jgi:phosphoribosylformylglycinamidine synthase
MESVIAFARDGGLVLGICNGFQVLCEAHLLPGALLPNVNLRFTCRQVALEVVNPDSAFTRAAAPGATLSIPAKHSWGRYHADEATLDALAARGQIVLRYAPGENFNGSARDVAGVQNEAGNVFGLMPHPEHAVDPLTGGSTDGLRIFESMRLAVEGLAVEGVEGARRLGEGRPGAGGTDSGGRPGGGPAPLPSSTPSQKAHA